MIFKISLDNIKLHAPIGVYAEEKISGNDFILSIAIDVDINETTLERDDIEGVINYADIAALSVETLSKPTDLIETAAWRAGKTILTEYGGDERILSVTVRLSKMHPPIDGIDIESSSATVTLVNISDEKVTK